MGPEEQAIIFGAGVVCGVVGGIGADAYRAWKGMVRMKPVATAALDCLCWCVLAAFVCALLLFLNGGDLRSYFFLALMLGYAVYRRIAGMRIVGLWRWWARLILQSGRWLCRLLAVLCLPLRFLIRKAMVLLRWLTKWLKPKRNLPPEEKT